MASPKEVIDTLKMLSQYYRHEPKEAAARLYVEALDEMPAGTLKQAVRAHIKKSSFFPRISELYEQAAKLGRTDARAVSAATLAWKATEAEHACYRGELPEWELARRYGRILSGAVLSEQQLQDHLTASGIAEVLECETCEGSGGCADDLEIDCPDCEGMGYFKIMISQGGAAESDVKTFEIPY